MPDVQGIQKTDLAQQSYRSSDDFYQLVRVIECSDKSKPPVGDSYSPQTDSVRFAQNVSLGFAPGTVSSIRQAEDKCPVVEVNFLGLTGPNGPLPLHVTEKILSMRRDGNTSLKAFLDLFNNRMIALFYKAWRMSKPAVAYTSSEDRFKLYISSIAGIAGDSFTGRDGIDDDYKRYCASALSSGVKNAEGLESMIEGYFNVPAKVMQFEGRWVPLNKDEMMHSGRSNCRLGLDTIIGERIWNCQIGIMVELGPLDRDVYKKFYKNEVLYGKLIDLLRTYCGDEYRVDVRFILKRHDAEGVCLGRRGNLGCLALLGGGGNDFSDINKYTMRDVI